MSGVTCDHDECCRYYLCAHPKCCGYAVPMLADRVPSEGT